MMSSSGYSHAHHAEVEKLFEPYNSAVSPGCAVAVIKDGQVVYKYACGMADLDHDVPIRSDSVFHVASVSKQFTAAAIILLNQEGKLSFDDEVRQYIPEVPDFGTPITIRHLVHHTSGLRDQWNLMDLAGWRYSLDLITDQDVLDLIAAQKDLNFKPGEKYVYCNTGYTLLAQIVKRISGMSFRQFTTERIFEPLGMNSTHFRDDHAEVVKNIAYGYMRGKGKDEFRLSIPRFDTVGATSLLTTVEDLALWDRNFYEPKVGGPELIQQMLEKGKLNNGQELDYSFGLVHGSYRGLKTICHNGSDAGYTAHFLCFAQQRFSVACLCNLADMNPAQFCRKIADICLLGKWIEPEHTTDAPEIKTMHFVGQELEVFAGLYWNDDDYYSRRVDFKEGRLLFSFDIDEHDKYYEMRPVAPKRFSLEELSSEIEFRNSKAGSPLILAYSYNGGEEIKLRAETEFEPTRDQLSEYTGIYRSEEIDPVYRITVEGDALMLTRFKHLPAGLKPTIADHFRSSLGCICFIRDCQDKVTGFVLNAVRVRNVKFEKSS